MPPKRFVTIARAERKVKFAQREEGHRSQGKARCPGRVPTRSLKFVRVTPLPRVSCRLLLLPPTDFPAGWSEVLPGRQCVPGSTLQTFVLPALSILAGE